VPLTGNILTRLSKLEKNSLDAIVLAFAGLKRLDLFERDGQLKGYPNLVGYSLSLESMVPAVGQGVLVTQTLVRDETITGFLKTINHKETEACITAERTLLKIMGGDCRTPIAAYCSPTSLSELHLRVFYKPSESEKPIRFELIGKLESPEELGARACQEIRKKI
jgi:hydroxymethylbilane synthase